MKNVILNNKLVRSVVLVSSLAMSAFSANADLVLSFSNDDINVELNDSFTVDLYVNTQNPVDSIMAWGLDAVFDNGIVALNSFTLGSQFSPGYSADGDLLAGAAPVPTGIFGSNILLGTFDFTATGLGNTELKTANTDADVFEGFTTLDFFGTPIFNSALANITVTGDAPVAASAPATLSLLAIALFGLVGLRRKA